jgi:putative ABC transport system substrate-binding protein
MQITTIGLDINTTGVSLLAPELDGKRQDLIIEAVPGIRRIAALADPQVSAPQHLQELKEGARPRDVEFLVFSLSTPEEITPAMNEASASGVAAINVLATPLFSSTVKSCWPARRRCACP